MGAEGKKNWDWAMEEVMKRKRVVEHNLETEPLYTDLDFLDYACLVVFRFDRDSNILTCTIIDEDRNFVQSYLANLALISSSLIIMAKSDSDFTRFKEIT